MSYWPSRSSLMAASYSACGLAAGTVPVATGAAAADASAALSRESRSTYWSFCWARARSSSCCRRSTSPRRRRISASCVSSCRAISTKAGLSSLRSIACMRPSSASMRSPFDCAAAPADAIRETTAKAASGSGIRMASASVDDLDAAVLFIGCFVRPFGRRALFAVTDGRELTIGRALQHQRAPHRLRTAFGQRNVVLARAAFIGVALEPDLGAAGTGEMPGVRRDQRREFRLDIAAVEVEIDDVGDARGRRTLRADTGPSRQALARADLAFACRAGAAFLRRRRVGAARLRVFLPTCAQAEAQDRDQQNGQPAHRSFS